MAVNPAGNARIKIYRENESTPSTDSAADTKVATNKESLRMLSGILLLALSTCGCNEPSLP
jgi:hypothetical protein